MHFPRNLRNINLFYTKFYDKSAVVNKVKHLHTSSSMKHLFYDPGPEDDVPLYKHAYDGLFLLKGEIKKWKNEVKDYWDISKTYDNIIPGVVDNVWSFESKEKVDEWKVTSDSDHNAGYSHCELFVNEYGKGVFRGYLNTEVPNDGEVIRTGYCNMKSRELMKSFKRSVYRDWTCYTYLVMRVRGDGRHYVLNLATPGFHDVVWSDIFTYVLHTRGGPYWQITKIPFSKFFLQARGKIQDAQFSIPLDMISSLGITIADKNTGPFQLEIDYIGLEYDPEFTEEFAYEMYKTPRNLADS